MTDGIQKVGVGDEFDGAILGLGRRCGQPDLLVYDVDKCIEILMKKDNMTQEEAVDFFEYNIVFYSHYFKLPNFPFFILFP